MRDNQMKQAEELESAAFKYYTDWKKDKRDDVIFPVDAFKAGFEARAKLTTSQVSEPVRMFPMQNPNLPIPWTLAEALYSAYSSVYGTGQSLERMAERGGFGWSEITGIIKDYPQSGIALRKRLEANPLPNLYLHPPTTTPQEAISPAIAEGWISVDDRLPDIDTEPNTSFLVMLTEDNNAGWSHTRPMVCEYKAFKGMTWSAFDGWSYENINMEGDVTHWMPLPSKPTELE